MTENRRAHLRIDIWLNAEINTGQELFMARAKNLSVGGVGLVADRPIADNTLVSIGISLVEEGIEDDISGTLQVQGQVVWSAPGEDGGYETGVRFGPLQSDQLQRLQAFLAQLPA